MIFNILTIDLVEEILGLFFRSTCTLCGKNSQEIICHQCRSEFNFIDSPVCVKCGIPLKQNIIESDTCPDCSSGQVPFSFCRSIFYYNGKARDAVLKLKFNRCRKILPILGDYLLDYVNNNSHLFSGFIMVPACGGSFKNSKSRLNVALELCNYLSQRIGIPCLDALEKIRPIKLQFNLQGKKDRWENVKGAFGVKPEIDVKDKKVLLIDDIITTGATIFNCSQALTEAGAQDVKVLTLCRSCKI